MSAPSPKPPISFEEFAEAFKREALRKKNMEESSSYVSTALTYAERLMASGLPVIFSQKHFCHLVGYSERYIDGISIASASYYRKFYIKKRNGGSREIAEPLPSLREIQSWIYHNILLRVPVSPAAKGFVPGKSLNDSARFHLGQNFVLRVDIEDFFPSISRNRVFGLFRSFGYSSNVAGLLSRLCCVDQVVPQGGVTSPYISNLVLRPMDARLLAFCRSKGLRYTRYADDLTVSGDRFSFNLLNFVEFVVHKEGFSANREKTAIMRRGSRQSVLGIVVNRYKNAPREYRRALRQSAYFIEKYGLDGHISRLGESRAGARAYYLGKASFALHVNPRDRDAAWLRRILNRRVRPESPEGR